MVKIQKLENQKLKVLGLIVPTRNGVEMASFRVPVGPVTITGTTTGKDGRFVSTAKCPFCSSTFTAEKKPYQNRTVAYLESSVRSMAKRHFDKKHKDK
jgi:hypothetical protein